MAQADMPYSLALGVDRHPGHYNYPKGNPGLVTRFARKVKDEYEVLVYPELVSKKGLHAPDIGPELETQLLSFLQEAKRIHFQIDGMVARGHGRKMQPRQVRSIREALRRGSLGTAVPKNVTNWEFFQVWNNFRDKTTFYWKSRVVDLTETMA
jgi:hypothetical protein